jgi:lysophospholipase L1-like esterase
VRSCFFCRLSGVLGPVAVAAALAAAFEGGLRLAGFEAKIASGPDPRANLLPLFRPAAAPDGTPILQRGDAPVVLRRDKPADGLRVFVLGESSVFGFPFGPDLAFARFLGDRLTAAFPGRTVEVANGGVPAVASWHVRRILEQEVVHYAPDVVIVYMGHNDWCVPAPAAAPTLPQALARSRLYQLATVAGARWRRWRYGPLDEQRLRATNDPFGYARLRARGLQHLSRRDQAELSARFAENLRAVVRGAQRAGARVLVATVGQNLRDFSPGASRHRRGISPAARARWAALAAAGRRSLEDGDCPAALTALRRARRLDPRPAIAHYLRGRCLDRLGRFGRARAAYRLASDLDEVPMGARTSTNAIIARVAAETGAQLVDVASAMARESPHGLVGEELFFDHVHPTIAGHVAIARQLARALAPPGGYSWPDAEQLVAGQPDARKRAVVASVIVDMMLGRYDTALRAVRDAERWFPELVEARAGIERGRETDPVRPWNDLPEAAD